MRRWNIIGGTVLAMACLPLALSAGPETGSGQAPPSQQVGAAGPAFAAETLDRLLAPIALYPDQLLAQMLLCATDPPGVGTFNEWLKKMTALKGTERQEAAQKAGFEPSFVAMALFPEVVDVMAKDIGWTTQLGQAFSGNRSAVFDSIQRLRARSREVGALKSTPQQNVETRTTESGEQVIVIEPANPQIVYVPQYNPQVVYVQAPSTTTVVVQEEDDGDDAAAAAVVGFAAGIAIGAAIDNDYYYGPYGWHGGGYMYNDAWEHREDAREDYYDHREDAREDYYDNRDDAREDWADSRENAAGERTERANTQQQRTERQQAGQEYKSTSPEQREQRRTDAQAAAPQARSTGASSYESRGYSQGQGQSRTTVDRSGTRSDAFSGYSSGKSERSASARGKSSRSGSRSGSRGGSRGGGRRR